MLFKNVRMETLSQYDTGPRTTLTGPPDNQRDTQTLHAPDGL